MTFHCDWCDKTPSEVAEFVKANQRAVTMCIACALKVADELDLLDSHYSGFPLSELPKVMEEFSGASECMKGVPPARGRGGS
jgi:hypothetical protein